MDQRPELLALGAALLLLGVGLVTDARGAFWAFGLVAPAMALGVIGLVLASRSGRNRSKNGN
jgi:hypothetical protein